MGLVSALHGHIDSLFEALSGAVGTPPDQLKVCCVWKCHAQMLTALTPAHLHLADLHSSGPSRSQIASFIEPDAHLQLDVVMVLPHSNPSSVFRLLPATRTEHSDLLRGCVLPCESQTEIMVLGNLCSQHGLVDCQPFREMDHKYPSGYS